jgi:hypothetical protein
MCVEDHFVCTHVCMYVYVCRQQGVSARLSFETSVDTLLRGGRVRVSSEMLRVVSGPHIGRSTGDRDRGGS